METVTENDYVTTNVNTYETTLDMVRYKYNKVLYIISSLFSHSEVFSYSSLVIYCYFTAVKDVNLTCF